MRGFLFFINLCVSVFLLIAGGWVVFELLLAMGGVVKEEGDIGILCFLWGGAWLGAVTTGVNALFLSSSRFELNNRPILFHGLNIVAILFFVFLGFATFFSGGMSLGFEKFVVAFMVVLLVLGYRAALPNSLKI